MDILITGATGFVGHNFLDWLLTHQPDARITCLVRNPQKAIDQWQGQTPEQVQWLPGDLLEPDTYRMAAQRASRVFHIAAKVSLKNGPEFYEQNTESTRRLLETLIDSRKLERIVMLGSISSIDRPMGVRADGPMNETTEPRPSTDYGKSKLLAEEAVIQSGLPYAILRPPYIFGPHPRLNSSMDRLVLDVYNGRHYTRFPFPGRASGIYVEDLAEMIWVASEHPGALNEVFFVANPEPVRVTDAFSAAAKAMNTSFKSDALSDAQIERARRVLVRRQPDNLLLRILFEDFFYCDTSKWLRATGHSPRYSFESAVQKTIAWYQQHGLMAR